MNKTHKKAGYFIFWYDNMDKSPLQYVDDSIIYFDTLDDAYWFIKDRVSLERVYPVYAELRSDKKFIHYKDIPMD